METVRKFVSDVMGVKASGNNLLSAVAIGYIVALWIAYRALIVLYNLSPLHPLSKFPGPRLAAATYLYEIYYDWWLVGRYTRQIQGMHERYG